MSEQRYGSVTIDGVEIPVTSVEIRADSKAARDIGLPSAQRMTREQIDTTARSASKPGAWVHVGIFADESDIKAICKASKFYLDGGHCWLHESFDRSCGIEGCASAEATEDAITIRYD